MIWLRDWPWVAVGLTMTGILGADGHHRALPLAAGMVAALAAWRYPTRARRILVLLGFLVVAWVRACWQFGAVSPLQGPSWADQRLEGAGRVISNPRKGKDSLSFWLYLERVENRPEVGALPILVQIRASQRTPLPLPKVALGERWRIEGRLGDLAGPSYPGDWDAGTELGRHGVAHRLRVSWGLDNGQRLESPRNWILRLRLALQGSLARLLRPREAALVTGVALGDPQELDEGLQQAFQRTGTSHLLAASGANVALIVALALGVGAFLGYGPKPLALPCLFFGLCYVALAGFAASIVRAGWMSVFALGARALGREADGSRCLALGVCCCLLSDPAALFDIGFQLSAGAVLSLVLLERPFAKLIPQALHICGLQRGLSGGMAVLYGLAPLFVYHFQEFNLAGLLANLLIAPPVESLLPVGLGLGLLGLVWPTLAQAVALVVQPWAGLCILWVELLARHIQPMALARPDLWCLATWIAGLVALLWPQARLWAALWGLVCALLSQPPALPESRARLVARYGKAVLWWSCPQSPDLLVVEEEGQMGWATSMARRHGAARVERVLDLSGRDPGVDLRGPQGLHVVQGPGRLEVNLGRFRLVWKTFARASLGDVGATVLIGPGQARAMTPLWVRVPRKSSPGVEEGVWDLARQPLEIRTDGISVTCTPWRAESFLQQFVPFHAPTAPRVVEGSPEDDHDRDLL